MGSVETRRVCTPQGHGVQENGTERALRNHVIVQNSFHVCIIVKCKGPWVSVGKYLHVTIRLNISLVKGKGERGGKERDSII